MGFDPFARGPYPVGVRSAVALDHGRADRELDYEVWYPADARSVGLDRSAARRDAFTVLPDGPTERQDAVRDAAARPGRYPLLLYSHASGGHRRQSAFLCTHLAGHGYVVAAADHAGNTAADAVERAKRAAAGEGLTESEREGHVRRIIADRVPDLRFLCDELQRGVMSDLIDPRRMGLIGWSFGGWAVLATLESDDRFSAVLALAPGGNSKPLPGIIPATLTFAWKREIATLILAAERDRFTPVPGVRELFERTPSQKRMYVLGGADHQHFADRIDDELDCPREHAYLFTRSLGLAHFDASLRESLAAQRFLASDPLAELRARGIAASD